MTLSPTKKMSKMRSRRRHGTRQRLTLKKLRAKLAYTRDPETGEKVLAHHVNTRTGRYKGEQIISKKSKNSSTTIDA